MAQQDGSGKKVIVKGIQQLWAFVPKHLRRSYEELLKKEDGVPAICEGGVYIPDLPGDPKRFPARCLVVVE